MSAANVARFILDEVAPDAERAITTWKLQKLVYYSQAWSTVWDDEPLFSDRIEAWANGPVCPDLYNQHRGKFKVCSEDISGSPDRLTDNQKETIQTVLEHYSGFGAQYLSELTHAEDPWIQAREGLRPGERGNNEITPDSMALYYGGL